MEDDGEGSDHLMGAEIKNHRTVGPADRPKESDGKSVYARRYVHLECKKNLRQAILRPGTGLQSMKGLHNTMSLFSKPSMVINRLANSGPQS